MSWRVCSTPDCGTLHEGSGKCPDCRQEADARRGPSSRRGYDRDYVRARAKALDGATNCFRCGTAFSAKNPATGGHLVDIRAGGTTADGIGAECRRCNYGRKSDGTDAG